MLAAALSLSLNMMCDSATDAASLEIGINAGTPISAQTHASGSDQTAPHVHGHNHGTEGVTHLHGHHDGTVHLAAAADAGKAAPDDDGGNCDCLGCWSVCHFNSVILTGSALVLPPLAGSRYAVDGQGTVPGADPNGLVRPPRPPAIA
jgi:hypothetical protein